MTRKELIEALKGYFSIKELVSKQVYKKYGEDKCWCFLNPMMLETLLILRRDILKVPMVVNNWSSGGTLEQRGLRSNKDPLVADKKDIYLSAHVLGSGIDFSSGKMSADKMRDFIEKNFGDEALEAKFENFMAVRSEVNKVLEVARRDKVIGNSLDASVELYATGEALEILQSVGEDLKTFLIVSQAKLVEGTSEEATATAREDLKVAVKAAAGQKCERCWIFSEEVGKDAEHPTLCPRCAAALK